MKRVISLFFVIMLVTAMVVPVMAAEPYVSDMVDYVDGSTFRFSFHSCIPEGAYTVSLLDRNGSLLVDLGTIDFAHDVNNYVLNPDSVVLSVTRLVDLGDGEGLSDFTLTYTGEIAVRDLAFIPVSSDASVTLPDVVTGDLMSGALDSVMSLLPVALGVLVGFIALRKGISFVRGLISGS